MTVGWIDRLAYLETIGLPKEKCGTGYWLSPNFLLTARHVIRRGDKAVEKIRVRAAIKPESVFEIDLRKDLAWEGDSDLDAALIRAIFPGESCQRQVFFSETSREHPVRGGGFAALTRRARAGKSLPDHVLRIGGTVYPRGSAGTELQITLSETTEEVEDLAGISGGPVLVGDQLAAILLAGPSGQPGKLLWALPVAELLKVPTFTALLRPSWQDQCRGVLDQLVAKLRTSPKVADVLKGCSPSWQAAGAESDEALARDICFHTSALEAHERISDAMAVLKEIEPARLNELFEIARLAFPMILAASRAERLEESQDHHVEVELATSIGAEILIAGLEGRAFALSRRGEVHVSEFELPGPAEHASTAAAEAADLARDLAARTRYDDPRRPVQDWAVNYLSSKFAYTLPAAFAKALRERPREIDPQIFDVMMEAIDLKMAGYSRRLKRQFYFLEGADRVWNPAVLDLLKQKLRAVRQVRLKGNPALDEMMLVSLVEEMLDTCSHEIPPSA
jgi:hypothetical protein